MLEPARTVNIFQKDAQLLEVAAGNVIFEVGQPGHLMYGVIEGSVDLVVKGKVAETISAGDIFGEGALVHPSRVRASTAIAQTDCKLACLDEKRFLFAVQSTPMFAIEVMRSFSDRLRRLKQQF
ncbi:MAG: Crp/Fnr family transcriptional regulator [Thermosynechococcaceae cyanobacterium MS004]|nr:Crp/Fnr family transcriptional regulator [Thermosynechococcaceae cyanobacterium MS004]